MKAIVKGQSIDIFEIPEPSSPFVEKEYAGVLSTGDRFNSSVPVRIGKYRPEFGGGYQAEWKEIGTNRPCSSPCTLQE